MVTKVRHGAQGARMPKRMAARRLVPREEPARLDLDQLDVLTARHGPLRAEAKVTRTLEDLGRHLADLTPLYRAARTADLARRARAMVEPARAVGLESYARVASDVAACAARDDWPALAAVLARLERTADQSMIALWDLTTTPS